MASVDKGEGEPTPNLEHLERLNENLARVEDLSQRLIAAFSRRTAARPELNAPDPEVFAKGMNAYWAEMVQNPAKIFEHQLEYWGKSVKHYLEIQQSLAKGSLEAPADELPDDPRFTNPLWKSNPYFSFVRQQYILNAKAIHQAVEDAEGLDPVERKRLSYFSKQIVDMMAPTNFLATNPDALEKAAATEGQSLVDGLENLVRDIEANDGELLVRLSDESAFQLGENIAATP
ncbi:MAG: class I poly(R)-hydroxyalkanoic acid synthase, partial [Pseudooceanicola sp.]